MEPIRPNESRNLDRRKRRVRDADHAAVGGFAERLAAESAVQTDDERVGEAEEARSAQDGRAGIGGTIEQLLDEVHTVGEQLLRERGFSSAQRYREAVRRFLGAIIPESAGIDIHESNRDILSRKRYYILHSVNQSVERLVTGVLQSQFEQIEILSRLEEIEGMLVDLLH